MSKIRQQRIVVGVSGSRASQAALGWAVGEARLRNAALHVLHVWDPARQLAPYAVSAADRTAEQERQAAHDRLAFAMRAEFGPGTNEGVTAELAKGVPERVLVDRSDGIDLLVLGSNAIAGQVGWCPGPVVRACLMHVRSPLVIITMTVRPPANLTARQHGPGCDRRPQEAVAMSAV
jgi:nucleotide-binding universal stress UspA family protein